MPGRGCGNQSEKKKKEKGGKEEAIKEVVESQS